MWNTLLISTYIKRSLVYNIISENQRNMKFNKETMVILKRYTLLWKTIENIVLRGSLISLYAVIL